MDVIARIELPLSLERSIETRYNPSPSGIGGRRGYLTDVELNDEELGEQIFEVLRDLLEEHRAHATKYLDEDEVDDAEIFLADLTARFDLELRM